VIGQERLVSHAEVRHRLGRARPSLRELALDAASGIRLPGGQRVDDHREQLDGENRGGAGGEQPDEQPPTTALRPPFVYASFQTDFRQLPRDPSRRFRISLQSVFNIPSVRENAEDRAGVGSPSSARIRSDPFERRIGSRESGSTAERFRCTQSRFSYSAR
jgi:hypothetical protein